MAGTAQRKDFAPVLSESLLPEDPRMNKMFEYITLETGLIVGTVLLVAGLAGSVYAFSIWGERDFGLLDPTRTLRLVIPAFTAITLGIQIILSSFFLSVLGLKHR